MAAADMARSIVEKLNAKPFEKGLTLIGLVIYHFVLSKLKPLSTPALPHRSLWQVTCCFLPTI